MASVFVLHCSDGKPCRHPLDEGLWTNVAWDRATAENDRRRLDDPAQSANAKFLEKNDPHAFAKWKGGAKAARCSPHRIIEYRPVQ